MTQFNVMILAMALTVIWNLYGFATNFFARAWGSAPIPVLPIAYLLNALIIAFIAFIALNQTGSTWVIATSAGLGLLMSVWSAGGVYFLRGRDVRFASHLPGVIGPLVPAVSGLVIAFAGFAAYRSLI